MELDRIDEALFDARSALERCAAATPDIRKILVRLQEDLAQRHAVVQRPSSPEGVDTTDL